MSDPLWDDILGLSEVPASFKQLAVKTWVETTYVDRDYRDLYYNYYSKKHFPYARLTPRVHFSRNDSWDEDSYLGNIVLYAPEKDHPALRPFKYNIRSEFLGSEWYRCESEFTVHALGHTYRFPRFPLITQDAEFTRCAHAAAWSNLTYFSERFSSYKHRHPSDIINDIEFFKAERHFPSSGLEIGEMCMILKRSGMFPKIYMSEAHKGFYTLLDIYLESGFPLIAGIAKYDKQKKENVSLHAINIFGHNRADVSKFNIGKVHVDRKGPYTFKYRDKYLIGDDNLFPYQVMKIDVSGVSYRIFDRLLTFIVPLPRQVNCLAEVVQEYIEFLDKGGKFPDFDSAAKLLAAKYGQILFRPFLATAGGFLENIRKNYEDKNEEYFRQFYKVGLPHFIWVIEITCESFLPDSSTFGHIILDATASCEGGRWSGALISWNFGHEMKLQDANRTWLSKRWTRTDSEVLDQRFPMMRRNLKPIS